jgi:cell division protein FtsL
MFTLTKFSNTERMICMLIAAVIAIVSLSLAFGVHFSWDHGYSVTITQLQ